MAWRDDNSKGNPWKKGDIPDAEYLVRRLKEFFGGGGLSVAVAIAIVIIGFIAFSCFYSIQPGEVGVVQRFGRYIRMATPGLNFKLPAGIEKVTKVKEQYVYTEEFGIRAITPGIRTQYAPERQFLGESLMLTGDLNCALVPWIVQYRIGDPYKFLFKVRNVQETLRDLSEAIMRQVVGDRSINEVITERLKIANEAKRLLQQAVNDADTGITIVNLELKKTTVPEPVQPSFNEVNQAMQEKEKMIYEAREDYNKAIPAARGEAERTIKAAEGYSLDRVNRAQGDATRFTALYEEYSKAKEITKRRIYLENLKELFPKMGDKYIIDSDQKNVLPFLNLGKQGKIQ